MKLDPLGKSSWNAPTTANIGNEEWILETQCFSPGKALLTPTRVKNL